MASTFNCPMANQRVPQNIIDELLRAGGEGNIDTLYRLIESHQSVLDEIDGTPFAETPLHVAASAGRALFAAELMVLKPSFARKLNKNGFTPLHLALQRKREVDLALQNHSREVRALQNQSNGVNALRNHSNVAPALAQRLLESLDLQKRLRNLVLDFVEFDKELIRVRGKGGLTPLHFVTQTGNLQLLVEFLNICPTSILDVTTSNETALHIALKHNKLRALQLLNEGLYRASLSEAFLSRLEVLDMKAESEIVSDTAIDEDSSQASPFY